jgi:hypothetical protein
MNSGKMWKVVRIGLCCSVAMAMLLGFGQTAQAEEIVITVKGMVKSGIDDYGIFKVGRNLAGQPFVIVFTFDDDATTDSFFCDGKPDGIGHYGTITDHPAKAVLTIAGSSYVFGEQENSEWGVFRGIADGCQGDRVAFDVKEGVYPQNSLLLVALAAMKGAPPLNASIDWGAPISRDSGIDPDPTFSAFSIVRQGDFEHYDRGVLIPEKFTVGVAKDSGSQSGQEVTSLEGQSNGHTDAPSPAAKPQKLSLKDRLKQAATDILLHHPNNAP